MIEIQTLEQIQKEIESKEPILIYFSGKNCSVCKILKPKIEEEIRNNFPKIIQCLQRSDIPIYPFN